MTNKSILSVTAAALLVGIVPAHMAKAQDVVDPSGRPALTSTIAPAVARALQREPEKPALTRRFQNQLAGTPSRGTRSTSRVNKILAGVLGGFGGMYAGAFVGSALEPNCRCDDPGLQGAVIGMPIGAIAGAMFGVWLAGR